MILQEASNHGNFRVSVKRMFYARMLPLCTIIGLFFASAVLAFEPQSPFASSFSRTRVVRKVVKTLPPSQKKVRPAEPIFGKLEKAILSSYNAEKQEMAAIQSIYHVVNSQQEETKLDKRNSIDEQPNAFARLLVNMYKRGL